MGETLIEKYRHVKVFLEICRYKYLVFYKVGKVLMALRKYIIFMKLPCRAEKEAGSEKLSCTEVLSLENI